METPIGDDEDSHLGDFIEDSTMQSPIEMATSESLRNPPAKSSPASLPGKPGAAHALRHRHEHRPHLEEVGKQFDVTRERIRQIEARRCASCAIRREASTCAPSSTSDERTPA